MKLNREGVALNAEERNKRNQNWTTLETEVTTVSDAVKEALPIAEEALGLSGNLQAQINTLVVEGDSSVEAKQARVDAKGVEAATLKARLDAEQQATTQQLAEKVGGERKAELEDLSPNVLGAIEGGEGTAFNLLSIPQDNSVTPGKVTESTYEVISTRENLNVLLADQQKSTTFNMAGDVANGVLDSTNLLLSKLSYQFVDNVDGVLPRHVSPKMLRHSINATTAGNVSHDKRYTNLIPGQTYSASSWFRLSDLLSIDGGGKFSPFIYILDESSSSLDALELPPFSATELQTVGSIQEATKNAGGVNAVTFTAKVVAHLNGWVYIVANLSNLGASVRGVRMYFPRFKSLVAGVTGKLDSVKFAFTQGELPPHITPYPNESTYMNSVVSMANVKQAINTNSKWHGKRWIVDGDSNTELNSVATRKYPNVIADKIGCEVTNHAVGGTGYFAMVDRPPIYTRIPNYSADADLITFLSGGNNFAGVLDGTIPLGQLGDTDPTLSYYGALEHTIITTINNHPNAVIACISQTRRGNVNAANKVQVLSDMVKALKEVCAKYTIPVLDLFNAGNLYMMNETFLAEHAPDGVHFNDKGQQLLSKKIESFIETL